MTVKRPRKGAMLGALSVIALLAVPVTAFAKPAEETNAEAANEQCPWSDTSKTPEERARLLMDASSLEQKFRWLNEQAANAPQSTTIGGVAYAQSPDCLPTVTFVDGPEGARAGTGLTAFPSGISIASTWDPELSFERGTAIADEAFDKQKNVILAPGLASGRYVLSGRTAEYLGEDPYLAGIIGGQAAKGIENNKDKPVMADLKHYVANEQELARQTSSSNMDERTLRQVYELPFDIALAESNAGSVMCSFNQVNGIWACENPILNEDLKKKGNWDGFVMSDFGSVHSTGASLRAGLDMELNRPRYYTPANLNAALEAGEITEEMVDEAAYRVSRAYIASGLFDTALPTQAVAAPTTPEHQEVARRVVEESYVLLKNQDHTLPLESSSLAGKNVAIIGPTASATATNGISARSVCSIAMRGNTTLRCDGLTVENDPATLISARAKAEGAAEVNFVPALTVEEANAAVADADVAIVFGYYQSGEFSDIPNLSLASNGDAIIDAVASKIDNTIVVLNTGSATDMPWLDKVGAVFEGWYPGDQVGPALTSLLFGDVNPSGKLPMSFPKSMEQSPVPSVTGETVDGILQVEYEEGLEVGYKWYDENNVEPLFPFGHGLSYTMYEYSNIKVDPQLDGDGKSVEVSFDLANVAHRPGTEVAQVYIEFPDSAGEPGKRLVGFDRVSLDNGDKQNVQMSILESASNHPLSIWSVEEQAWVVPEGTYKLYVGTSSRDLSAPVEFTIGGQPSDLTVDAKVDVRCVAKKAVVAVNAVNTSDTDIDVTLNTEFGKKSFTSVAPGKSSMHVFSTKAGSIEAGNVTAEISGAGVDDGPVQTQSIPYDATDCR